MITAMLAACLIALEGAPRAGAQEVTSEATAETVDCAADITAS
jgi:hypothetical protein